jgi:carbamoyl-phosphate synthase small subunit
MTASATLVLEDGTVCTGSAFGASTDAVFELVFNTGMTGYQEVLTDPSYRGQAVLFTAPHIGNVGVNLEDMESEVPQVEAVVVRRLSPVVSNWRAVQDLDGWLAAHGVPGIADVDTRALTMRLRSQGTLRAALSARGTPAADLLAMARAWPGLDGRDMVREVTCPEPYAWTGDPGAAWLASGAVRPGPGPHLVVYDFGSKRNIMRHLAARGARVTVVPAATTWQAALAFHPDGVVLSNGPGDPAGLPYAVEATRGLLEAGLPVLGICLGHQLMGRALGGSTRRLKFGHHGINHPVQELRTGAVQITSQNHNYCVEPESLNPEIVDITHLSLNDGSLEGMRLRGRPALSVQYHPEASAGPHDAEPIFDQFFALL